MSKLNILTVDDAAFIRDLIKRTLKGFFPDIYIDEAPNGKRAQSLLQRNQYDLILCDWEMPELSGLEVLTWLREQESIESLPKTPFIMVTSRGDKDNVVQAVEAGVSDYIGKPFSNEQLLKKVLKALSRDHKNYIAGLLSKNRTNNNPFEKNIASAADTAPTKKEDGNILAQHSASEKVLTKPSSAAKPSRLGTSSKGSATLRTPDFELTGKIKDISLKEILLTLPRPEVVPKLFDQVVVDIEVPDLKAADGIARINGFVCSSLVPDKNEDGKIVQIGVKYVDSDPDKLEVLARFISRS